LWVQESHCGLAVTKKFERGPIKSTVSAFPNVFSVANFRLKNAESSEPRVRFRGYY